MARLLLADDDARAALGTIEHVMIGGEAFPPSLAAELVALCPGTLTNMYGPTETTIWSSTQRVESGASSIPIGRPIANTRMYVLDRYQAPVPVGVPGDLYLGGDGVTRGYHRRAELTAERFLADPFRPDDARMYWTGDLARYRPDGVIEFLGRVDQQVKIRGYRIELGEIEALLDGHPGVRMSAVVLREDTPGDQRLVAYVVPEGDAPTDAALRGRLREGLPEYMLPGRFISLARMPLTPNGKIDRKALPAPKDSAPATRGAMVPPANELERAIAQCWEATLAVEAVGVEDNFFDIGGHSLLVVQLHRTLGEALEQSISLVDLYRFPTIRALTNHLSLAGSSSAAEQGADRAQRRKQALARRGGRKG
jgi:acyl-coenzyme A synthetase/AMP-(fatty) acid ligase